MKLISCHIENFGTLHDTDIRFTEGLNIYKENNGRGKSTLAVFIKAMLYGLPHSTSADLDKNDREHYRPWQGGAFGGSIIFEAGGKTYRAERFFPDQGKDRFALYDLAGNRPSEDFSAKLGEELFAMDADVYERTAYLPQKLLDGGFQHKSIAEKFSQLIGDSGDTVDCETAIRHLEQQRKVYAKKGNHGKIADLQDAIADAEREKVRCLTAATEAQDVLSRAKETEQQISDGEAECRSLRDSAAAAEREKMRRATAEHGRTLLDRQDDLIAKAADCRAFLGTVYPDESSFFHAYHTAEQNLQDYSLEKERFSAEKEPYDLLSARADRLRKCFPQGVPTNESVQKAEQLAAERSLLISEDTDAGMPPPAELPQALAESVLSEKLKQAASLSSAEEKLSEPFDENIVETALASISAASAEEIPDDKLLRGWESDAEKLLVCCKEIRQAEEQKAAMDVVWADTVSENVPTETELQDMQLRYQNLQPKKTEIDQLELQQHALADAGRDARERRRNLRLTGILLFAAALGCAAAGYFLKKPLFYYAALLPAIAGVIFLCVSLLRRSPAIDEQTDRLQKRLCACKAAYEDDKSAILTFFDTYTKENLTGIDGSESSEIYELFHTIGAAIRHRQDVASRRTEAEQTIADRNRERMEIGSHLAPYFSRFGIDSVSPDDLPGAISAYRQAVTDARMTIHEAQQTISGRRQLQADADRIRAELDTYLASLESELPDSIPDVGRPDYLARLMAWKTQAGRLVHQNQQRQKTLERLAQLDKQLADFCALENPEAVCLLPEEERFTGQTPFEAFCSRIRLFRDTVGECTVRKTAVENAEQAMTAARSALDAYLLQYYPAGWADDGEALHAVGTSGRALADLLPQLKDAVKALRTFCTEKQISEESLRTMLQNGASEVSFPDASETRKQEETLMNSLASLREEKARLWQQAEQLSRTGEEAAEWQEKILSMEDEKQKAEASLKTILAAEQFLEQAKEALSTRYLDVMQERFRAYYGMLSGAVGDADRITLDAAMQAQTEICGERHSEDYLSRGLRDLVSLCIRFALVDTLFLSGGQTQECPVLILDDPFVNLDSDNLHAARSLLDRMAEKYQILYFVCHESRA